MVRKSPQGARFQEQLLLLREETREWRLLALKSGTASRRDREANSNVNRVTSRESEDTRGCVFIVYIMAYVFKIMSIFTKVQGNL